MRKSGRTSSSSKQSSPPCDQRFRMFSLYRRPYRSEAMKYQTKTPPPRAQILPTRFLKAYKVTVTFDPHFERTKEERLPLLTPTDDDENNDKNLKSDAPYREIPTFLRLRRSRGMRHTGMMVIALTGCVSTHRYAVAYRSKQGKRTAPFSGVGNANACGEDLSALKGTPPDPRAEYLLKRGNRY